MEFLLFFVVCIPVAGVLAFVAVASSIWKDDKNKTLSSIERKKADTAMREELEELEQRKYRKYLEARRQLRKTPVKLSFEEWYIKYHEKIKIILLGDPDAGKPASDLLPAELLRELSSISEVCDWLLSLDGIINTQIDKNAGIRLFREE